MQILPIDSVLPELLAALGQHSAVVLEAPPGAGKTTRVPRAIEEAGLARGRDVLVAEPRRLAARMAARRVASERSERLGDRVGYRVRFEDVAGPNTRVVYMTEGVLLRRLLAEPKLPSAGVVILDEFHERHLETDLLLCLVARLSRTTRPDLKLVVMSATLDAEPVARFLDDCPRIRSAGRMYPVSVEHIPEPDSRPLEKQVVSAVRRLRGADPGDVLVFLPGAAEIRRAQEALVPLAAEQDLLVVPLHGDLPIADQARAIEPAARPKVVLSTNVAESSVTIEGVTSVVDSGLARIAGHSPWTGLPTLGTAKVSRASAIQRAGRAGRTREGQVLRLYTAGDFQARPEHDVPEILRADLTEALLLLHGAAAVGSELRWLVAPPDAAVRAAEQLLALLGALDAHGTLSPVGRRLIDLPLHPRLGRVVVEGEVLGIERDAALAAALLGERDIRSTQRGLHGANARADVPSGPSDVLELMDAFEVARSLDFDARRVRAHDLDGRSVDAVARAERQLLKAVRKRAAPPDGPERVEAALLQALLSGFPDRLAKRRKPGSAELILASGSTARLSPSSVVKEGELLVALDVEERSSGLGSGEATVRLASSVRAEWLFDRYADRIELGEELTWNDTAERVESTSKMAFGAVVLEESRSAAAATPEALEVLLRAVGGRGAREFLQNEAMVSLRERLALLAQHYPKSAWPTVDGEGIRAALAELSEGATSFEALRAVDLVSVFTSRLDSEQRRLLEREVPERVRLPGGRTVAIHYEPGRPPWIESRLQDFFGMPEGPRLCSGRVPVTLHLLAPNARAVQVTTDLEGFWERHYPGIRRELMRRYPRHSWPEDGRHAEPPKPRR